ncbi:PTS sugar transporter subunit IIA [Methylocystis echinoides]|uniref:PTS sugar transporter subunit IIA n=1 Tax=Methylocystis echinoides TaxID=29468 RepID=UPI00341EF263
MLDTVEIALFAGLGVLFAIGLIVLSRWSKTRPALLAAYALIAVCFLYVGFAIRAENYEMWIGFEMTAVAFFGTLAGMSIVGSPWFVVAGFALHAAWTLYEHYVGAGQAFAPAPFVVATVGFDVAVALYVAYMTLRGKQADAAGAAPARKLAARSQNRKGAA